MFAIIRMLLGRTGRLEITSKKFSEIRRARTLTASGLGIEEKYDLVIGNLLEYEKSLLSIAVEDMARIKVAWSAFREDLHSINRHIVNFLSAGRLYVDHVRHDISRIFGRNSPAYVKIAAATDISDKSPIAYRFIHALRNHVQHAGLPVHVLGYPSSWEPKGEFKRLKFGVSPMVEASRLVEDPKCDHAMVNSLKDKKGLIALSPMFRQFMEAIWMIHDEVRTSIQNELRAADAVIEGAREDARAVFGDELLDLAAVKLNKEGRVVESEDLIVDLIKHRRQLEDRNRSLKLFSKWYVSSRAEEASEDPA